MSEMFLSIGIVSNIQFNNIYLINSIMISAASFVESKNVNLLN